MAGSEKKELRFGFTTGSCAAAAAAGAAYMLLSGRKKEKVSIETPKGIRYDAELVDIEREERRVRCAVVKDAGDDPDITNGTKIFAEVALLDSAADAGIEIAGGIGVGTVTKPGLDQPVGNAAINHVPREMITKEVKAMCGLFDYRGSLLCTISVPDGERLAGKTFNPRLGIVGGISILGTSGVVEPMSSQAILDTIRAELSVQRASGKEIVAVSPGNYGQDYMKSAYGYDIDKSVKCSNYIGECLNYAMDLGFRKLLLTGHIGKLIKVSGGILDTHSRMGDCRMELLTAATLIAGIDADTARQVLSSVTTEDGLKLIKEAGLLEGSMNVVMEKVMDTLNRRADGRMQVECIMYSNDFGCLGMSGGAMELLTALKDL